MQEYRERMLSEVARLDPESWRQAHEQLRRSAHTFDKNGSLYLLLRLVPWHQREALTGGISLALWVRHAAEVIRRAFEEVHNFQWPEEDQAFEIWTEGARHRLFGDDRPLDDTLRSKPLLADHFGLFTGSVARWYVEGETEYYAVSEALPTAAKLGVELVNLRGVIAGGRDNIALKLEDWLRQDRVLRRFSIISFDTDVGENLKVIQRQVEQGNVVGVVYAHDPDFEFANFTLQELIEVAARFDESAGDSGESIRTGDWSEITNGSTFEKRYREVSRRRARLKGPSWGRALAAYAEQNPLFANTDIERPFVSAVRAAISSRDANYTYQAEHLYIDPQSFEVKQTEA
jgi:hypothetical protein